LPPYLDGSEGEVETGLPLGLVPDVVYVESTFTLPGGSSITFFSDSVVEAENAQRELFGFERTREISGKPAAEIAAAARARVQNDEITVVFHEADSVIVDRRSRRERAEPAVDRNGRSGRGARRLECANSIIDAIIVT